MVNAKTAIRLLMPLKCARARLGPERLRCAVQISEKHK
jgi:hypothetical protein